MMLINLRSGDHGRIVAIEAGQGARNWLALRGISEGCALRVISCRGPIVIEVDRNTIALGRGIAQKVRVV